MRIFTLFISLSSLLFAASDVGAQTTLIPVADGNFSNGATFAANGWTASSSANNPWVVGTAVSTSPFSGNVAYISNDGGTTNAYTPTDNATNFFWRDITIPAGETKIILTFNWAQQGESTWDIWQVFTAPTSVTPVGVNTHPGSGTSNVPAAITGATYVGNGSLVTGVQTATYYLPASLAGTTFRLIFSWKNETGGTQPPAAIDNITCTSSMPGNYTSVATGDWTNPATWGTTDFPTILDNVTVSTGHTVTVNALNLGANNLNVSGTVNFNTTATTLVIGEGLTVNSGGVLNMFNSTTGKRLNVAGNITNNGTIDLSIGASSTGTGTNGVLSLTGTGVQTISGTGVWTGNSIRNLQTNNTSTTYPNIEWMVNNLVVLNSLSLTGARFDLNGNTLQLGNSANTAPTFTAPGGSGFMGGTFGRWWTTSVTGVTISASADPTAAASSTTNGHYPFVSVSGLNASDRSMWINRSSSSTTGNTAGYLNISYTDGTGMSTISTVADGTYSIDRQFNGSWTISATGGYVYASGTHKIATKSNNAYFPNTANSRLMLASSVIGTHEAGTATPGAHRTTLSTAQLTGAAWFMGINSTELPVTSVLNGPWESGSTWSTGVVPTCNDAVVVAHQVTISGTGNVAKGVLVAAGGVLTMTAGDLTVDACTPRADASFDIGQGTFNMQGGTLNVKGRFRTLDTQTGQFIQSGGDIFVDGNNGVLAESVAAHIVDFFCNNTNHLQLTGGQLVVVDPPLSTTTTNCAFKVFPATGNFSSGSGWQLKLGNGTTTNNGGHSNGYLINLTNSGSFKIGGTLLVDAASGGTNRHVATSNNFPVNNVRIISGEYRAASAHFISGNIVNGGTLVSTSTLTFSDWSGSAGILGSNASLITGGGVFNNATSAPTANLVSLTINTTGGLTLDVPLSLSSTLTLTKGIITTSSTNWLRVGTATANGTVSGTPADDTHVDGPFRRTFGSVTASNTFTTTQLFPTGKGGVYRPIWISPTATTGGTIFNAEAFSTNSGSAGAGVTNLSNDTWEVSVVQQNGLTALHTQLGSSAITSTNQILQAASASGTYGGTATGTLYTAGTPNTLKTNPTGAPLTYPAQWTGFLAYGDLTPCVAPTAQPTSMVISQLGATSLQVNYSAASPAADGYIVVRYPTAAPTITDPVNGTAYALSATLGAGTVVAVGTQLQVIQTGLTASTTYTYVVYAYNGIGCGGGPVYLITSPLQSSATTCATAVTAPTGFGATARSMTTMTYTWTGTAPAYELDVATDAGYTNFVAGYNAKSVTTPPEVITGLNPATTYYLRIRALDGGCYSANTTATNGTLCSATPAPMTENLNSALTCLSVINVSGGNIWSVGAAPTTPSGMTGNTARILSSTSTATNAYFVAQAVNLTGGTSYDVNFKYGNTTTTGSLNLEVLYSLAGANGAIVTTGATQLVNLPLVANTVSNTATVSLVPPVTGDYYILFRANNAIVTTTSTLHLDDISVVVTPPCTAATAGTIVSSLAGSACGNTNTTTLTASGFSLGTGSSYQWEKSTNGTSWSNMGALITSPAQPNAPFTSDVFTAGDNYYRLRAECANGMLTGLSNVIGPISYSNPALLTTTPGTRCGVGTVNLGATATPGDVISWYAAPAGGGKLGVGSSFTTPSINTTTDFYAAAATPQAGVNITQGAGATTSATYSNPFYSAWSNIHTQHLITAAELSASGLFPGNINSVALNITSAGTLPMIDLSVKIGHTSTTSLTAFDNNAGFTTVYTSASLLPTTGVNVLTFSTPFNWDGTSNIILEFCHGNASSTATMSRTCLADNTSYNSTIKTHISAATSAATICPDVTSNLLTYTVRPQFTFNGVGACEGTRQAITATVTAPPALTLSATSSTLCAGTPSPLITVTSNVGDYDTYVWSPATGVSGTAASGFTFNPASTTSYTLTATQTGGALCQSVLSYNVVVNPVPTSVTASATPTTVCAPSGNSQLNVEVSGLPGTIKITEITQFRTGTGATNPYPGYFAAGDQDYVEISNISNGSVDVSGYVFELWSGTTLNRSLTIPSGTILPANGVMTIVLALGTDIPASFYFHCVGTSTSTSGPLSSGVAYGFILKNGTTNIDVVGTNAYAFPVAANVLPADWSGSAVSASGNAGTVRTGTTDTNTGADWTTSSTTTQTIGTYNTGYVPGSSITSYAWTPSTFLSSSSIANPIATALNATTTYSVVVTTNEGCTASSNNVTVELVTGAAITTQPPAALPQCQGSTAAITVVASGPSLTYQWKKDGTPLSNGGTISGATSATLTITGIVAADAGNYTVDVVSTCGSTVTSNGTVLTVETVFPTANVTPPSATICTGQSVTLTASGGVTYAWTPATGLSGTNTAAVNANPSVSTVYTVAVSNAGGCSATATTSITVVDAPTISVTPVTQTMNCGDIQAITVNETVLAKDYGFAPSTGTFVPLSGGTGVPTIVADDAVSGAIPIGFTFNFEGTNYSNVIASSNGWLSFNASAVTATVAQQRENQSFATTPTVMLPLVAPLWDDLDGSGSSGTASYQTTGTAPNRVFTFEWLNWEWDYLSGATPVISFQAKLYEGTNKIEFVYQDEPGTPTSSAASIGIMTSATNYKMLNGTGASPTASSSVFTTNLATEPATGQVYAFNKTLATYAWTPTTDLYQDAAATIAYAGQNLATVYTKPTASRVYTVSASNGACTSMATSTITAQNCESILTLTQTFIEGYMDGATMRPVLLNSGVSGASSAQCDTVTVALHASTTPYAQVYSAKVVLGITGAATVAFPGGASGNSYYIVIRGRNLVETWSANPVAFTSSASYNFGSASQAFGSNLGTVGGVAVIYSGDIDAVPSGDGNVDLFDFSAWETEYNNFASGYFKEDLNGDGNVDLFDFSIWESNYNNFVSKVTP